MSKKDTFDVYISLTFGNKLLYENVIYDYGSICKEINKKVLSYNDFTKWLISKGYEGKVDKERKPFENE